MARVEYTGAPETEPSLNAGDDYRRVETPPAAFGQPIAEGLEKIGQGGLEATKFYGQAAADNATNNTLEQVTNALYGDPNQTTQGPDGKPVPDTGYFGLRGADAMQMRQHVAQHIDDIIAENRSSLSTIGSQQQYDVDTRRYRAQWLAKMGEFSDTQQKVWSANTNTTTANLAYNSAARDPGNDALAAQEQEVARNALVKNAQLNGENTDGAILKADQDVLLARIRSAAITNPPLAQKLFADKGQILASLPNYDEIGRTVKGLYIDSQLGPMVDGSIANAQSDATTAVSGSHAAGRGFDSAWDFTLSHEGGYSPKDANGQPVKYGINQSAHPGVDIKNLTPAGAKDIARQYWDKSGAADLPPGLDALHFDTYFINPGEATRLLEQSGGDAQKYLQLRKDWMDSLVAKDPARFGRYEKAWNQRNADLGALIAKAPGTVYPSTADYYRGNYDRLVSDFHDTAEQKFPNYPDAVERATTAYERRLNQTITQQNMQYEVDTHTVQAAMAGPHPPTSEESLIGTNPQTAAAWQRMKVNNPYGAMAVERMFDANAKGRSISYGTNFPRLLERVLAPVGDPSRLGNPSQLWPLVTGGENGVLTNSGASALSEVMAFRSGKDNESASGQLRSVLSQARGAISFANDTAGVKDPNGEKRYEAFVRQALPVFMQASPADRAKLLDPKNADGLQAMAGSFARTPAERIKDFMYDVPETGSGHALLASFQTMHGTDERKKALRDAVSNGTISREEGIRIGIEMGYITPHTNAPKPQAQRAVPSGPDVPLPEEVRGQ